MHGVGGARNDGDTTKPLLCLSAHGNVRHLLCWFGQDMLSCDNRAQITHSIFFLSTSSHAVPYFLGKPVHYFRISCWQETVLANIGHCLVGLTAHALSASITNLRYNHGQCSGHVILNAINFWKIWHLQNVNVNVPLRKDNVEEHMRKIESLRQKNKHGFVNSSPSVALNNL